jgi:hypothetical protein
VPPPGIAQGFGRHVSGVLFFGMEFARTILISFRALRRLPMAISADMHIQESRASPSARAYISVSTASLHLNPAKNGGGRFSPFRVHHRFCRIWITSPADLASN